MPACDCCHRMLGHGQGIQHPTVDAIICGECYLRTLGRSIERRHRLLAQSQEVPSGRSGGPDE